MQEPDPSSLKGKLEDWSGIPTYVVGQGSAAIIVAHDIFGVRSGRTRQICDDLADALGVIVVAPYFFNGDGCGGLVSGPAVENFMSPLPGSVQRSFLPRFFQALWHLPTWYREFKSTTWEAIAPKLYDNIVPKVKSRGAKKIGLLGYCWGGWFNCHASSSPEFACAVGFHPSPVRVAKNLGDDWKKALDEIACPQMMLNAKEDDAETKPGGIFEEVLSKKPFGAENVITTFDDMRHGWMNRGLLSDPLVARDYEKGMTMAKTFFKKHLEL